MAGSGQWRWRLAAIAVGLALVGRIEAQAAGQGRDLRAAVSASGGRVLITLRAPEGAALREAGAPMLSAAEADRITSRLEAEHGIIARGRSLRAGVLFAHLDDADLAALAADPEVATVEPDVLTFLGDASPSLTLPTMARRAAVVADVIPWGVSRVGADVAWAAGYTGSGVKVGIIDSGIDPAHPDLNVAGGYDFTTASGSASAYADNIGSCNGHGTHVAGTVGARQNGSGVVGVAPGVQLYALKVFEIINGGCAAWSSNQIAAIDWAVSNGVRVLNLSIASSTALNAYQNAINNATAAGVLVVAAAGNNSGGPITYPAAYDNAVAVGALTSSDQLAYYSNVGPQMWVSAPGSGITSTMPGGGTGSKSGTSMAAPHVAGVAALLMQQNPGWSATQIRNALRDGAFDLAAPGWDSGTGWGMVKAPAGSGGSALTLAVSPGSRYASLQQGGSAPTGQASVTLSGTGASAATWSAAKRKSWTTLTTSSGTGSGTVAWSRNASGLAPGTYVDTITVTAAGAAGSPGTVIDTMVITSAPTPLTLAVSPTSRRVSVQQGTGAPGDQATVTLSGTNASSTSWSATKRKSWTTLTTSSGTGSGTVAWSRNTTGLAAGTYVDTITVTAAGATGSPARVIDTLVISSAPVAPILAVSPTSRRATAVQGGSAPSDQASVTITGSGAGSAAWSATRGRAWITLTRATGTGSGTLAWTRSAAGLVPGTYVDTIRVAATGVQNSPALLIDSLIVTAPPTGELTLAVTPGSRSATVQTGAFAPSDQATVSLTGNNAASTAWSATKGSAWITLTSSGGTGSGDLRWNRDAAGLSPGTYVDTIRVTAAGATGSPAFVVDTMVVTAFDPIVVAVYPGSRRVEVPAGNGNVADAADIVITGSAAAGANWTATARQGWTNVQTSHGTGSAQLRWQRRINGLVPGTYVDTITVTSGSSSAQMVDSLVIVTPTGGEVILSRGGGRKKQLRMDGQQTSIEGDSVVVQGISGGLTSGTWTARDGASWIVLETTSGGFPGLLKWNRNTVGLGVGTHVDSIIVELASDPAFRAVYVDSIQVVNVVTPTPALAADALFRGPSALTADQRAILDAGGNRNGQYDLGDFLAWVDRSNIRLTAGIMAQVQAALRAEDAEPVVPGDGSGEVNRPRH